MEFACISENWTREVGKHARRYDALPLSSNIIGSLINIFISYYRRISARFLQRQHKRRQAQRAKCLLEIMERPPLSLMLHLSLQRTQPPHLARIAKPRPKIKAGTLEETTKERDIRMTKMGSLVDIRPTL